MYSVVRKFQDNDKRIYNRGDVYPHADAKKPTHARIKLLSSTNNKYEKIFIEKVK